MSEVAIVDELAARLESVVSEFEPGVFDATLAARMTEAFARIERLGAAGKALAARRVEECGTWRAEGYRSGAHWLAEKSGVTVGAAEGALRTARAIESLPATASAFRAGELSEAQASEVSSAAIEAPDAEGELLVARESSVKSLRDECRQVRAASVADDRAWAAKQQTARRLDCWTDADGMDRGDWKLPPATGARVAVALNDEIDRIWREARRAGRREPRTAYAADALVNLITRGPLKPPEVKLTASCAAVERGSLEPGEVCEIEGVGPVPVTVARALLNDARVSVLIGEGDDIRFVTSPKPTIPRRFRRRLEARDRVCAIPGCGNARFLEIDHIVGRAEGGQTEMENLWRLCPHHHRLKTYFGWCVALDEKGRHTLVPPPGATREKGAADESPRRNRDGPGPGSERLFLDQGG